MDSPSHRWSHLCGGIVPFAPETSPGTGLFTLQKLKNRGVRCRLVTNSPVDTLGCGVCQIGVQNTMLVFPQKEAAEIFHACSGVSPPALIFWSEDQIHCRYITCRTAFRRHGYRLPVFPQKQSLLIQQTVCHLTTIGRLLTGGGLLCKSTESVGYYIDIFLLCATEAAGDVGH